MRKKANPVRNKNSNRVNVFNSIRIGNNKKRSNRKKSNSKSGVSSIIVNVPQNIPQPFYIPTTMNSPFPIQPPVPNLQNTNPTKIMNDEMERELVSANSQYINSKPTFVQPRTSSSNTPLNIPLNTGVGADEAIRPLNPIRIIPNNNIEVNRLMRANNQFQLQSMAQDMGIALFDENNKQRTKQTLAQLILKKK